MKIDEVEIMDIGKEIVRGNFAEELMDGVGI